MQSVQMEEWPLIQAIELAILFFVDLDLSWILSWNPLKQYLGLSVKQCQFLCVLISKDDQYFRTTVLFLLILVIDKYN